MKRLRQAIRSCSGLLLAGAVLFQVTLLSAQTPSATLRQAQGMAQGKLGSGQAIPIAVMDFDGFGISQVEAIALSNRLRNELFRLGTFDVVDRGMMENILTEQDFQMAGCTSNECLVEVGQLLGARQMIGGSISKVGAMFTVSARVVDVETGKLLGVSDFDLRGGIEEMLTGGMREVAIMLSGPVPVEEAPPKEVAVVDRAAPDEESSDKVISPAEREAAPPQQPATTTEEKAAEQIQPRLPVSLALQKSHRWQSRIGGRLNGYECFTVSLSYDLPGYLNLWDVQFQPIVSGGSLSRGYSHDDYTDYDKTEYEWILHGMLELHRKWAQSSNAGNLGASVYGGFGLGWCKYGYFADVEEDDKGLSWIFATGAQVKGKFSILPTLVANARLVVTPNFGSSVVFSFGSQGSFLQVAIMNAILFLLVLGQGFW